MVVGELTQETELLIIGGGPGGYHTAFRAAEHGIQTTIVESMPKLGGVCLHRGCIPSKTYLSAAETLHIASSAKQVGIDFGKAKIDIKAMREWKNQVVNKLAGGLDALCKKHGVEKIQGTARFEDSRHVLVSGEHGLRIKFGKCVIATGSRSIVLKGMQPDSPRILTSRTALDLDDIPKTLLVLGGGYIGLELGQVYASLGSKVAVVEMLPNICAGADSDLARPLIKRLKSQFEEICLETKVTGMKEIKTGIQVDFEGKNPPQTNKFDKVLVSVGRRPNSDELELANAGVQADERGFITVNENFQTSASRIYAIGDVIGDPMLAHKAIHEGTVVADRLAGKDEVFEPRAIPAVVFTDPELAWAGLTEVEAKEQGKQVTVKKIPWTASGRAVSIGRTDGLTKIIADKETQRVLGIGIAGPHAGEMIAEGVLAMEMGATAYDLHKTIHPHPTLSETIYEVSGMFGHG
ncbi:MAG: dihydrolipoyl dehydrogenase [Planctomycetota bacterium]|jgi:dihydrolipoamide dehydrogenase